MNIKSTGPTLALYKKKQSSLTEITLPVSPNPAATNGEVILRNYRAVLHNTAYL